MGGETKASVSAWTIDSLKEFVSEEVTALTRIQDERDRRYEDRFKAMDEKTSLALTASEKAVVKAEIATEKRFDSVNEFRGTLSDQAANLLPRQEATARFEALEAKFAALKDDVTRGVGVGAGSKAVKDEGRANVGLIVSLAMGAVGVVGLLFGAITLALRFAGK